MAARRPEIDWLKGFAILCVLLNHAKPLEGYAIQARLIERAVPMFVVLFGMTSQHWWEARAATPLSALFLEWYRTRCRRLMVPLWATLAVWWTLVTVCEHAPDLRYVVLSTLGYLPRIGTGWFVTLLLELVVLFPLLHVGARIAGEVPVLVASAALLVSSYAAMLPIGEQLRVLLRDSGPPGYPFYYFWIFAPAWLYPVAVGLMLTRRRVRVTATSAAVCVALAWTILHLASRRPIDFRAYGAIVALIDPLVTMAMLGIVPVVAWWRPAARFLAWCGASSWGIYLGQLLVHDAFGMFGLSIPDLSPALRWGYFACLVVGAIGLVVLGEATRSALSRQRP